MTRARRGGWLAVAIFAVASLGASGMARASGPVLRFLRSGAPVRQLELADLESHCKVEVAAVQDPLSGREVRLRGCPLVQVLKLGFGPLPKSFAWKGVLLHAEDGYLALARGQKLLEPGGLLAFAEADARGDSGAGDRWKPMGPRQIDPGPFYLVWTGAQQSPAAGYPWPYQLVAIEIASFEKRFPHTLPLSAPVGGPAWRGYALFKARCASCHPINGEGGHVGPDLNVPRSIVEYRPERQIRAFIRDPSSFRYTSMPANPELGESEMNALMAYLRTMSHLKHDPGPGGAH